MSAVLSMRSRDVAVSHHDSHDLVVGHSAGWAGAMKRARLVAATEATVLLQGESGTGKEVMARLIHAMSPREKRPFVAINCAALPENLLESELFGYERGAFTGAQQTKPGQVKIAAGGVLFLDEVSEMSLAAQAKFLRGIRHALPLLIARGGGSIVNTMSSEVWMGEGQRVAYQTAKSGLIGLNRHTATVGGKHGVRSNIVAPGVTLTAAAMRILNEEYRNQMLASVRSTRLVVPEDIAAMVAFLFSDDAAYVNGQTILVDGGANLS